MKKDVTLTRSGFECVVEIDEKAVYVWDTRDSWHRIIASKYSKEPITAKQFKDVLDKADELMLIAKENDKTMEDYFKVGGTE